MLTLLLKPIRSFDALPQKLAGLILILIALVLVGLQALDFQFRPAFGSTLLLMILVVIWLAISKTPGGITSLIGLFFLGTVIFIAARPLLALVMESDIVYSFTWGTTVDAEGLFLSKLLAFWIIGVASLFGGYFVSFKNCKFNLSALGDQAKTFWKLTFWIAFAVLMLVIPVLAKSKFDIFISSGYEALYAGQTQYAFNPLRVADFLAPALFGIAVLIDEAMYTRVMAVAIVAYIFTGVLVGQRSALGAWVLVGAWYISALKMKRIHRAALMIGAALLAGLFQWIEILRGGSGSATLFLEQFALNQGLIFFLPLLASGLPSPPVHTVIGSYFPMGAAYSILGIGDAGTSSFGNYISSHVEPELFAQGYGLGSSVYLESYYASGRVLLVFLVFGILLGMSLRKWEEMAHRSRVALFCLCICLPSIFLVQRGSLNGMTSQLLYTSILLATSSSVSLVLMYAGRLPRRSDASN